MILWKQTIYSCVTLKDGHFFCNTHQKALSSDWGTHSFLLLFILSFLKNIFKNKKLKYYSGTCAAAKKKSFTILLISIVSVNLQELLLSFKIKITNLQIAKEQEMNLKFKWRSQKYKKMLFYEEQFKS